MSAPATYSPPSISSSGHADGLGRRVIVFDREDGAMLEALHLRPELGAFEAALRERIERIAAFDDERIARVRGVDRDPDTGELVVVSEFVPGSRLSDLLDVAQEAAQDGITPGVDVALGYLLEALPAISALHRTIGVAHGAIAPARTVLTPAGQVVYLDAFFGQILDRLRFSRKRLWHEFGLAMRPSPGPPHFDVAADIAQIALNAVMLVLGRPLRRNEFPDALPSLIMEVVDVAQIRGASEFAEGVHRFLETALPLPDRRAYTHADEAIADVRQVTQREIGLHACRRALIEFIAETAEGLATIARSHDDHIERAAWHTETVRPHVPVPQIGFLPDEPRDSIELAADTDRAATSGPLEQEIVLDIDNIVVPFDLDLVPDEHTRNLEEPAAALVEPFVLEPVVPDPCVPEPFVAEPIVPEPLVAEPFAAEPFAAEPFVAEPFVAEPVVPEPAVSEPFVAEPFVPDPFVPELAVSDSPRRKRQRSVRARKDKLRSIAAAARSVIVSSHPKVEAAPLIPPDRAAAFDAAGDDPGPVRAPIGFAPRATPPVAPAPVAAPEPPPALARPVFPATPAAIPMPRFPAAATAPAYGAPSSTIWNAPPLATEPTATAVNALAIQAPPQPAPPAPAAAPIRFKTDAVTGWTPKPVRREPRAVRPVATEPHFLHGETPVVEQPRSFPWKLAVAVVIIVAAGIIAGRWYLPSRQDGPEVDPASSTVTSASTDAATGAAASSSGHIDVQTQPAGARVLLDGKPAGETPLKLDVFPGRHVLTLVSASGSVKRNVRVDAGKSITVDVPLFSGWIAIFAPFVLDVSENGKSIGSSADERLMLSPGWHELTFSNRALGYTHKQSVDIDPGEVTSLSLEPRGTVNFNAVPWAEVWIDGKKAGDTPLANAQVPLGDREVVFKNPDFGERRMVTTVRAGSAAAVSVDFTK